MYSRIRENQIKKDLFKGKVLMLIGARQVGKTTLAKKIISDLKTKGLSLTGDDPADVEILKNKSFEFIQQVIGDNKIIFIDKIQKIENAGNLLKLMVDNFGKDKQIIVTGSSSINLLDMTSEPLTGRKFVYNLFPLSLQEINPSPRELPGVINNLLIFGSYPEIASQNTIEEKIKRLTEIASSYLYKDVFNFQDIRNPDVIRSLLKALAFQIGNEVSLPSLSSTLGTDAKTLARYIDLLEKSFVIFKLGAYSSHKNREISKNKKIFFYDLGIRNAIINNFNFLDSRQDIGQLWENYIITERLKYRSYNNIFASQYFWRTYDGSEIDLVEEREGKLFGYEIKWNKKKKSNTR